MITNGHREIDTLHVAFLDENLTALAADGAHLVLRDQLAPPQLLNRAVKIGRHLSWRWMCLKGEREVVAVRACAKKERGGEISPSLPMKTEKREKARKAAGKVAIETCIAFVHKKCLLGVYDRF